MVFNFTSTADTLPACFSQCAWHGDTDELTTTSRFAMRDPLTGQLYQAIPGTQMLKVPEDRLRVRSLNLTVRVLDRV